jgi:hypothetical protein
MILAARTLSAKSYSIACARGFFTWGAPRPIHQFLVSFTAKFSALIGKGVIQCASWLWGKIPPRKNPSTELDLSQNPSSGKSLPAKFLHRKYLLAKSL